MQDDYTQSRPLEPTTPVPHRQVEKTAPVPYPYGDGDIGIPPPLPPLPRKRHVWVWVALIALLVVGGTGYAAYQYGIQSAARSMPPRVQQPTAPAQQATTAAATTTPTVPPYTAQDIVDAMIARNLLVGNVQHGASLHYFYYDRLYNDAESVPFQSSAIWQTTEYPGDCYETCIGLWVYSSRSAATTVYSELFTDAEQAMQTPPSGPTRYPNVMLSGRCMADAAGGTPYAAVIRSYCV